MRSDRALYGRMALAVAILLAVNGVLVAAITWPLWALAGTGVPFPAVFGAVFVLLLAGEYVYLRRVEFGSLAAGEDHPRREELEAVATRLSAQLRLAPPSVVVVDAERPNSLAVGGITTGTVVLTSGLLEILDEDELEAVLAHELAHLHNRDAFLVSLASVLPVTFYRIAGVTGFRDLGGGEGERVRNAGVENPGESVRWPLFVVAGMVGIVAVTAFFPSARRPEVAILLLAAAPASLFAHRLLGGFAFLSVVVLSRYRELAADRAAVLATGEPAALASALEKLYDEHDAVDPVMAPLQGNRIQFLTIAPTPIDTVTASFDEIPVVEAIAEAFDGTWVASIDPEFHPPLETRLDRLGDVSRRQERR